MFSEYSRILWNKILMMHTFATFCTNLCLFYTIFMVWFSWLVRKYGSRNQLGVNQPYIVRTRHPALHGAIYLHPKTGLARHPVKGRYDFLWVPQEPPGSGVHWLVLPRTREQLGQPSCSTGKQRSRESKPLFPFHSIAPQQKQNRSMTQIRGVTLISQWLIVLTFIDSN